MAKDTYQSSLLLGALVQSGRESARLTKDGDQVAVPITFLQEFNDPPVFQLGITLFEAFDTKDDGNVTSSGVPAVSLTVDSTSLTGKSVSVLVSAARMPVASFLSMAFNWIAIGNPKRP